MRKILLFFAAALVLLGSGTEGTAAEGRSSLRGDAEVKKFLPFLSIILLIAGFLLCINVRTLRFVQQINAFFYDRGDGDARRSNSSNYQLDKLDLSPADRAFLEEFLPCRLDIGWRRKMGDV